MSNLRLSHLYNLLSAFLAVKGTLTLREALLVCEVHTFSDLRLFNRVVREMAKAGLRQGDHLQAAPEPTK